LYHPTSETRNREMDDTMNTQVLAASVMIFAVAAYIFVLVTKMRDRRKWEAAERRRHDLRRFGS
jgi:hypothetical protein